MTDGNGEDAMGAVVDALALVHGLTIEPDWRPAVMANVDAIARAARLVMDYTPGAADEPAPVFFASWAGR